MPTSDAVAIILLNWNRKKDTEKSVESCPVSVKLYVLNNGCTEPEEYRPDDQRRVTVVNSAKNLGYAAGVNLLASRALADGAEWLLLLNNDATLQPGALDALALTAGPGVAAVCPMIIEQSSGRVWSVGGRISPRTGRVSSDYHGWQPDEVPLSSSEVDFGTGACLLVSGQLMRELGGLDTTYFAYWEETDWCRRARDAGYRVVTCPAARAVHVGSASTPTAFRLYLMIRNALLYLRRHSSTFELARYVPILLLWTLPSWTVRPLGVDPKGTGRAVARALRWHARRRVPAPAVELP